MIFHNINIQGSWGNANKVSNKCPNDELYDCDDLANILHDVVEFGGALMHAVGCMIKHSQMVEMHAGYLGMVVCM